MKIYKVSLFGQKQVDKLTCSCCERKFIEQEKIFPFYSCEVVKKNKPAGFKQIILRYFFFEFWRLEKIERSHIIQKEYKVYICENCMMTGLNP